MRDEEFLIFWTLLFGFVLAIVVLAQRHRLKLERQRTIQKALESPALDDVARRQVLELLAARDGDLLAAVSRHALPAVRTLVFVGGWLTMLIGGGVAVFSYLDRSMYSERFEATLTAIVGFALVTLPLALRELRARTAV